jgi:hypothetical protein
MILRGARFVVLAIASIIISIYTWNFLLNETIEEDTIFYGIKAHGLEQESSKIDHDDDLVLYALDKINEDRASYKLPPVNLSKNKAAQIHAENLFATRNQHPSHWTTDGMKPYMKYSEYNGTGYVEQNVAIRGYENSVIQECENGDVICEKIEPYQQIDELQWNMVNNDTSCCANKHKANILDRTHNNVSIGIAHDSYYLALVQNFENNLINFDRPITQDNRIIHLSGKMTSELELDNIGIYYDNTPNKLLYEKNRDKSSYELGKLIAQVVKPPPAFSQYKPAGNFTLIEASKWIQDGRSLDIIFDMSSVVKTDGVYTIVVYLKDNEGTEFPVTSHSIFI